MFARRHIVIPAEFADTALAGALCTPWPTLADISPAGTRVEEGRPVLTIFADGATPDDVERHLRQRAAAIERELYACQ